MTSRLKAADPTIVEAPSSPTTVMADTLEEPAPAAKAEDNADFSYDDTLMRFKIVTVYHCNPKLCKKMEQKYLRMIPAAGVVQVPGDTTKECLGF